MTTQAFSADLLERVQHAVQPGQVINTLGIARRNRIVAISRDGILVETDRSDAMGKGPQLVPAWMVEIAWDHLCLHGHLSNQQLLNDLNVKRSAFVCALLSHFAEVQVDSLRPIVLRLINSG